MGMQVGGAAPAASPNVIPVCLAHLLVRKRHRIVVKDRMLRRPAPDAARIINPTCEGQPRQDVGDPNEPTRFRRSVPVSVLNAAREGKWRAAVSDDFSSDGVVAEASGAGSPARAGAGFAAACNRGPCPVYWDPDDVSPVPGPIDGS